MATNITSNRVHLRLHSEKCRFWLIHAFCLTWAVLCTSTLTAAVFENRDIPTHLSFLLLLCPLYVSPRNHVLTKKKKKPPPTEFWLEAVRRPMDETGIKHSRDIWERDVGHSLKTRSVQHSQAQSVSLAPGRFYHFWWQHEGGHKDVGLISPSCNSLEVQAARREV